MRADVPPDARVVGHHAERDEPLDPRLPVRVRRERRRRAAARQLREHAGAVREHAVRTPSTNGEFAESASTTGSQPSTASSRSSAALRALDADVHVQPVHALAPRGVADLLRASPGTAPPARRAATRAQRVGCAPAAAITSPCSRAIACGGGAQLAAAPRPPRRRSRRRPVVSSTTDACSSVFSVPGSSSSLASQRARRPPPPGASVSASRIITSSSTPSEKRRRLAEVALDHLRMPCTGRPAASHA